MRARPEGSQAQQAYGADADPASGTGTATSSTTPTASSSRRTACVVTGTSPDGKLVEIIELPDHPWFLAVQFHPEFKSKPTKAHPLFRDFIAAAIFRREQGRLELEAR